MNSKDNPETFLDPGMTADLQRLSETGIEPPRDLWPQLEHEIRSQVRPVRRAVWRYAAAAVVLLAALAGISWRLTQRPLDNELQTFGASRSLADLPQASSEELRATFVQYLSDRDQILDLIAKQLRDYPPELGDDIRRSVAEIERAMKDIEVSIAQRPTDVESEVRLAELYELELRLLGLVKDRLREGVS